MGMVWEAYHKGVPLLGVPEITLEQTLEEENIAKSVSKGFWVSDFCPTPRILTPQNWQFRGPKNTPAIHVPTPSLQGPMILNSFLICLNLF